MFTLCSTMVHLCVLATFGLTVDEMKCMIRNVFIDHIMLIEFFILLYCNEKVRVMRWMDFKENAMAARDISLL